MSQSDTIDSARTETARSLTEMLQAYLSSFGLVDRVAVAGSARRVAAAALEPRSGEEDPRAVRERALRTARRWIERFAQRMNGDDHDWYFAIPALLRRFPRMFLETDLPESDALESGLVPGDLLPAEHRCRMRAQGIAGEVVRFPAERSVSSSP